MTKENQITVASSMTSIRPFPISIEPRVNYREQLLTDENIETVRSHSMFKRDEVYYDHHSDDSAS